jgi:hypothetical protein
MLMSVNLNKCGTRKPCYDFKHKVEIIIQCSLGSRVENLAIKTGQEEVRRRHNYHARCELSKNSSTLF